MTASKPGGSAATAPAAMPAVEFDGAPTEEEAVAIMAAVEGLWPKPIVLVAEETPARQSSWRFSNRWWSQPVQHRRGRPFR